LSSNPCRQNDGPPTNQVPSSYSWVSLCITKPSELLAFPCLPFRFSGSVRLKIEKHGINNDVFLFKADSPSPILSRRSASSFMGQRVKTSLECWTEICVFLYRLAFPLVFRFPPEQFSPPPLIVQKRTATEAGQRDSQTFYPSPKTIHLSSCEKAHLRRGLGLKACPVGSTFFFTPPRVLLSLDFFFLPFSASFFSLMRQMPAALPLVIDMQRDSPD